VRDKSILREVNDQYLEITTPYLDRHNDYTQIYVRKDNGGFVLTDGGDTIQDLRASGSDLETSKRGDLLQARSLTRYETTTSCRCCGATATK
jgi:hypothetical protein